MDMRLTEESSSKIGQSKVGFRQMTLTQQTAICYRKKIFNIHLTSSSFAPICNTCSVDAGPGDPAIAGWEIARTSLEKRAFVEMR